jgi:hypothetical protein
MMKSCPPAVWCACVVAVVALATADAGAQTPAPDPQGKVVAVTGKVEHTAAEREAWNRATVFQPLFVSERVRTLAASKAAILFIDESQVKLNAGAVLTVHTVQRAGGATTSLGLERVTWFARRNHGSGLTITTPAAAAAVRGPKSTSSCAPTTRRCSPLWRIAEFSNAAGSILRTPARKERAPGQAPTKRVILIGERGPVGAALPGRSAWRDLPRTLLAGGDVAARGGAAALAADARAAALLLSTIS